MHMQKKVGASLETIQFLISNDCGNSWVISRGLNPTAASMNSEFSPSSSQWQSMSIGINNSFFSPNFRFKIKLKNGNGNNFYIDNININNVVGIDELDVLSTINIYPNPMTEKAIVKLDIKKEAKVSIYLMNTIGEIVHQIATEETITQGNSKFEINKNNLSKGLYFVTIEVNGTKKINKLMIN